MAALVIKEFDIKQTALLPVIATQLVGTDGNPLNLTSCTVVFRMKRHSSRDALITGPAVIITGNEALPAGSILPNVYYQWVSGDTNVIGPYDVEWEVTFPGGLTMILPGIGYNIVRVSPKLV